MQKYYNKRGSLSWKRPEGCLKVGAGRFAAYQLVEVVEGGFSEI